MLTSQHCPTGVAFLEALHAFAHALPNTDPRNANLGTFLLAPSMEQHSAQHVHALRTTAASTGSAHQRLPFQHASNRLTLLAQRFFEACSALPGVSHQGLRPYVSYTFYAPDHDFGNNTSRGIGQVSLQSLHSNTHHGVRTHHDRYRLFGATGSFAEAAQRLLTAIDTLCDVAPSQGAHAWRATRSVHPSQPHKPLAPWLRANSAVDALIIAPIAAWDWGQGETAVVPLG